MSESVGEIKEPTGDQEKTDPKSEDTTNTKPKVEEVIGETKSEDKQEIEDEEREAMVQDGDKTEQVNESEVEKKKKALEEAASKEVPRKRIPIGGIKIPGFLRPKSRDKPKEGEADAEEGAELLEPQSTTVQVEDSKEDQPQASGPKLPAFLTNIRIPQKWQFWKKEEGQGGTGEGEPETGDKDKEEKDPKEAKEEEASAPRKPKLINPVKLPIVAELRKKFKTNKDTGDGGETGTAGLASVETLDDSNKIEDNMETVKLDPVEGDPEKAALKAEETVASSKWAQHRWLRNGQERFEQYLPLFKEYKYPIVGVAIFLLLLIIVIAVLASGPSVPVHAPVIDGKYIHAVTSCGPVEGLVDHGVFSFRGIPYAVPPVGALRWLPPKPFTLSECWNSTYKAHNSTPPCWQIYTNGSLDGVEDCLTLDIITPHVRYDNPLPVVVLVGADTLLGGSPGVLELSSPVSRTKEVVFVRINFRMSVLGFLAARPLSRASYPHSSGNYGLQDIVAALKWIRLNVQHFGGDARSITVLAHRAGATLVSALTSTHKAENLFDRAWLSSPSFRFPERSLHDSEQTAEEYYPNLDCSSTPTAECLRRQDVEELLDGIPEPWRTVIGELPKPNDPTPHEWLVQDGIVLRQHPRLSWGERNVSVQVVVGTTVHSEYMRATQLKQGKSDWSSEQVIHYLKTSEIGQTEGLLNSTLTRYNASVSGLHAILADIRTICPIVKNFRLISSSRFYIVTQPRGEPQLVDHGSDLDAILGRYSVTNPEQQRYVKTIQDLFFNFVHHATPPPFKMNSIGQDIQQIKEWEHCAFWDQWDFEKFARVD